MRWPLICTSLILIGAASLAGQAPPPPTRPPAPPSSQDAATGALPVRRVVLYKTGVGYFEHLGHVRNRQDVTVRFTSAQLNDVLKSLTTIDRKASPPAVYAAAGRSGEQARDASHRDRRDGEAAGHRA